MSDIAVSHRTKTKVVLLHHLPQPFWKGAMASHGATSLALRHTVFLDVGCTRNALCLTSQTVYAESGDCNTRSELLLHYSDGKHPLGVAEYKIVSGQIIFDLRYASMLA